MKRRVDEERGGGGASKVAQLVRCRTSNQRVAGSIPRHSGHFGRSWAKQFIPYCFSLPSCKMGT